MPVGDVAERARLIADLIRAANQIERLRTVEKQQLLNRALKAVESTPDSEGRGPAITELGELESSVADGIPNERISAALLKAGDALRRVNVIATRHRDDSQ